MILPMMMLGDMFRIYHDERDFNPRCRHDVRFARQSPEWSNFRPNCQLTKPLADAFGHIGSKSAQTVLLSVAWWVFARGEVVVILRGPSLGRNSTLPLPIEFPCLDRYMPTLLFIFRRGGGFETPKRICPPLLAT